MLSKINKEYGNKKIKTVVSNLEFNNNVKKIIKIRKFL